MNLLANLFLILISAVAISSYITEKPKFSYLTVIDVIESSSDSIIVVDKLIHINELSETPFKINKFEFYSPSINTNGSTFVDSSLNTNFERSNLNIKLIKQEKIKKAKINDFFLFSTPIYSKKKDAVIIKVKHIISRLNFEEEDYYLVFTGFRNGTWNDVYKIDHSYDFVAISEEDNIKLMKKIK